MDSGSEKTTVIWLLDVLPLRRHISPS